MILFLLLLILAAVGVGVYASENTGTHPVTFLQWHWSAVSDWVPVVIAAAVIGVLFLLYMFYSGLVHGVRIGSMRRRVSTRENAINDMRGENQRLRRKCPASRRAAWDGPWRGGWGTPTVQSKRRSATSREQPYRRWRACCRRRQRRTGPDGTGLSPTTNLRRAGTRLLQRTRAGGLLSPGLLAGDRALPMWKGSIRLKA